MDDFNLRPWIGLDSYDEQNSELFYGRPEEIKEILSSVNYNIQTVIFGPSGIGKSSIIKAGIFPQARKKNFLPIYIRLDHNDELTYPKQIIKITKEELKNYSADIENNLKITDNNEESLWEFFQSSIFWSKDNFPLTPLIVIDQFEEIFTLARNKKSVDSFFEQLSDLVNNYIPKYVRDYISENKVYIKFPDEINYKLIIILREDFLGKLEEYDAKYPSLKKNRYSLQAINEEQAKDIILKPGGNLVNIDVAKKIIKKITNEAEFEFDDIPEITVEPALLSLFCTELNEKRISEQKDKISLQLIEDFGDDIIKEFYERETSKVNEKTIEFLENRLLTSSGYRDSIALDNAFEYGIQEAELKTLEDSRIIRISEQHKLKRIEYTHDVLCKVAKENKNQRKGRQHKYEVQKSKKIALLATLISFCLIIAIVWCLDSFFFMHIQYYNTFIKRKGIPVGVGELSKKQVQHRSVSFRLIKKGRHNNVIRIEAINSNFDLTPYHNVRTYFDPNTYNYSIKRECIWEFVYDKNSSVVYEKGFDKNNNFVWGFIYSPIKDSIRFATYVDSTYFPSCQMNSSAYVIKFKYDKDGFEHIQRYYDLNHSPITGPDNAYGRKFEYDDRGLPVKMYSLDKEGKEDKEKYINDKAGNAVLKLKYDKMGNFLEEEAYDDQLNLTTFKEGYAKARAHYDEYGNPLEILYFGIDGKPILNKSGYYKLKKEYDSYGYVCKESYFDAKDKPKILEDGYTSCSLKYNNQGQLLKIQYFDTNCPITINYYGYHAIEYFYNENGNVKKIQYLDTINRLINNVFGFAIEEKEFDPNNNLTEVRYYNENNRPAFHKDGYHSFMQTWEGKNVVKRIYLGELLQPFRIKDGYYGWTKKYDEKGNETEISFIDYDGKLVNNINGYAIERKIYDIQGNLISGSFFDDKGRRVVIKGYSSYLATFDIYKNETSISYFNEKKEPVKINGYVKRTKEYDKFGQLIMENYFNEKGKPFVNALLGYASFKREYDRKWHKIKEFYFDEVGNITKNKQGYAGKKYGYDLFGNNIYIELLDIDTSKIITCKEGWSRQDRKYNENGECTEIAYKKDNKLVINNSLKYAKVTFVLKKGKKIETLYFDNNNKPVNSNENFAAMKTGYDIWGNIVQESYFGTLQHNKVNNIYGYAELNREYDKQGNLIKEKLFDENGNIVFNEEEGYAYLVDKFNIRNQLEEVTFYDSKNRIVVSPKYNYAKFIQKYDSLGNLIEVSYYDNHSNLIEIENGYAKITYEYNKSNKLNKLTYYGTNGSRCPIRDNTFSSIEYLYNDKIIEYQYYDSNNNLICNKDGYAILKNYYDKAGDLVKQSCYDEKNKETFMKNGPHCFKYAYDTLGNRIEERYYDTKYRLFMYCDEYYYPCARWKDEYIEKSTNRKRYYYNSDNTLMKVVSF